MKVKTSYENAIDITPGKVYGGEVLLGRLVKIYDDTNYPIRIRVSDENPCAHLNGEGHWEVVED